MSPVWVNGRILDTSQPKAEKWSPPPKPEKEFFGSCADCGKTVYKMDTIWFLHDRLVCIDCHRPYLEAGLGHMDAAGLDLDIALEG